MMGTAGFDAAAKEAALRAESSGWDTSVRSDAEPGDIPVVDVAEFLSTGSSASQNAAAERINEACETVGFFQLTGHDVDPGLIDEAFDATRSFHALPLETKRRVLMDRTEWPLGGVGYLPLMARKLPARDRGNLNEAFLVKRAAGLGFDDNQWIDEGLLPGFRNVVERYSAAIAGLAEQLVRLYAVALGLGPDHFDTAFEDPSWRLRFTHYPASVEGAGAGDHGIAPHVDTTFFTLLLQDAPGLTIYSHVREQWIRAPHIEHAYVVNSGELLKQWTNDRYLSVRHLADSNGSESRYSIPFFFNANGDHPMQCLPTCHGPDNLPKYPTISYNESQAGAQGE